VASPRVADPVDRVAHSYGVEHGGGRVGAVLQGVPVAGVTARAVTGSGDEDQSSVLGEVRDNPVPGALVDEQAVPQHGGRAVGIVTLDAHLEAADGGLDHAFGHPGAYFLWWPRPCRRAGR